MILIYLGAQHTQQSAYEQVLQTMQLPVRFLSDAQTEATLNELFEHREHEQHAHPLPHPLMVMKDVSDAQFQRIMQQFHANSLSMERKAMWTVHNQDWSFARLAEEIEEEHRYFADREQLYAIFSASNHKDPQAYAPASWKAYAATLTRLYGQLVRQEPSPQELKAMLEEAKAAEAALLPRSILNTDQ